MTQKVSKNKSPFKFFLVIIIIIMFLTVIVDLSSNEKNLNIPGNAGILDLSTCDNYLVALTNDNRVHLWDWQVLSGEPVKSGAASTPAVVLDSEQIVQYEPDAYNALVIKKIDTNNKVVEYPLNPDYRLIHISAARDRSILAALLAHTSNTNDDASNVYQLVTIRPATEQYRSIINIGSDTSDYRLKQCTISDDGRWGVVLGARQDQGVIIVIDILQKHIVREIEPPGVKLFDHAVFEPAGNWFFAGGDDLVLYKIQTDSGKIISSFPVDDEILSTSSQTAFRDIVVSPDGKKVAAITTTYKGGVWDCATGKNIIKSIFLEKIAATVAFSPDSSLLAIGPLQAGGQISIIRLQK